MNYLRSTRRLPLFSDEHEKKGRSEFYFAKLLIGVKYLLLSLIGFGNERYSSINRSIYGLLKSKNTLKCSSIQKLGSAANKKNRLGSYFASVSKIKHYVAYYASSDKSHTKALLGMASRDPHKVVNLCTENQNRQKLMGNKQVVKIITNSFYIGKGH